MMFMNEMEIEEACYRHASHPALGPATRTLLNLMSWANQNSDGWHSWPKPCRSARQLQELIEGYRTADSPRCESCSVLGSQRHYRWCDRPDVTADAVKRAYRPIRSFRTVQCRGDKGKPWFT